VKRIIAGTTALATLLSAQAATAQAAASCVSEREVAQLAVYAVPSMVEGVRGKCAKTLSSSGYLATKGTALASRYAALQGETWPEAKRAIAKFATAKADAETANTFATLAGLPDEAVRPLVDALIAQKIGETIKTKDCSKVERGIQLLSPLGPRDSGALVGFIFAMVKPDAVAICPAKP
jgi:hypothetical protein